MKNKSFKRTIIILIIIFLIVVVAGRYFLNSQATQSTYSPGATSTVATVTPSTISRSGTSETTSSSTQSQQLSCPDAIRQELAAKNESYAKGEILVTFGADSTYDTAKDVLADYGLVVQNEVDSQSSFKTRHLITAAVSPNQEITKVCELRNDANIKYAGLDIYFGIHE